MIGKNIINLFLGMIGKNNVLNIRSTSSKWKGKTGATRGFCDFDSVKSCLRVGLYLFERTYPKRGLLSIRQMIYVYAPPEDHNLTEEYISFVCKNIPRSSRFPYLKLTNTEKYYLFKSMCKIETGYYLSYETFINVYNSFKNEK